MIQYIADAFTDTLFAGNPAAESCAYDWQKARVLITGNAVLFMKGEIPFDL